MGKEILGKYNYGKKFSFFLMFSCVVEEQHNLSKEDHNNLGFCTRFFHYEHVLVVTSKKPVVLIFFLHVVIICKKLP